MATTKSLNRQQYFMIAVMLSGCFIAAFNQTIIAPALPSIMRDLHIDAVGGQWLTTIFLLVNGIMVPCSAYLIDRFTTRQLYLASMVIFMGGTALAGSAHVFSVLLVARVLQAIGFGILMPLITTVFLFIIPRERRGRAMGILGLIMSVAPAVGPSIAGYVVDKYSWNMVFYGLVPFVILDIILAFFVLKDLIPTRHPSLDVPSIFLSTMGFGTLLYGFSIAGNKGWTHPITIASIIIGIVVIYIFVQRQRKMKEPLLNFEVFSNSQFTLGTILGMLINGALIVGGIVTPIYLQTVLNYSAFQSAILMFPSAIVMAILSVISGPIFDEHGPRHLVLVGLFIVSSGTFLYLTFNEQTTFWYAMIIYTYRVAGMGLIMMPVNTWALNDLPDRLLAHGNAVGNTFRQIAGSIGTAMIVTIMMMANTLHQSEGYAHATVVGMHAAFFTVGLLTTITWLVAFFKIKD